MSSIFIIDVLKPLEAAAAVKSYGREQIIELWFEFLDTHMREPAYVYGSEEARSSLWQKFLKKHGQPIQ